MDNVMLYSIIGGVAALVVIATVVTIVFIKKKKSSDSTETPSDIPDADEAEDDTPEPQTPSAPAAPVDASEVPASEGGAVVTPEEPKKEGFLLSTQPARISSVTGAIIGNGIMTDQMTRMPLSEITKQVNTNGLVSDGAISIGVAVGKGFDQVYQNQLDIQSLDDKAVGGYQQREDLTEISHKIGNNTNNANFNLFSRGGSTPTKLILAKDEVRCVIDEKYLPERDKNHQIATVNTVIPMQGYDINIERMGEMLNDTHFSSWSSNKPHKRNQTASGATTNNESANAKVVNQEIKSNGDVAVVTNATEGADVAVKLDKTPESFIKYAKY